MPVEIRGKQNATQVGMAFENDTEHIERLAFMPVCCFPDVCHSPHVRCILAQKHLQTKAVEMDRREEMIIHLESRIFFRPSVGSADVGEQIKALSTFQVLADLIDRIAGNDSSDLAKSVDYVRDP